MNKKFGLIGLAVSFAMGYVVGKTNTLVVVNREYETRLAESNKETRDLFENAARLEEPFSHQTDDGTTYLISVIKKDEF